MNCPPELSEIFLDMLGYGIVRIRSLAWSGESELCALHADHLHNLPSLIAEYKPEKLRYYWEAERELFISRTAEGQSGRWEEFWERLRPLVEPLLKEQSSR